MLWEAQVRGLESLVFAWGKHGIKINESRGINDRSLTSGIKKSYRNKRNSVFLRYITFSLMKTQSNMYKLFLITIGSLLLLFSPQPAFGSPGEKARAAVSKEFITRIKGYDAQDYSGITWLGDDRYAVISDKRDGYFEFRLDMQADGSIGKAEVTGFFGNDSLSRDCEGIVYHPGRGTLFISGESDQEIREYTLEGNKTGFKLNVPPLFKEIRNNFGFEALGYCNTTDLFWTTTESTLLPDGEPGTSQNRVPNLLRIQSFDGKTLQPVGQYAYRTEKPNGRWKTRFYAYGVPAITALPDGRLLVLEREFYISRLLLFSWVQCRLYLVDPRNQTEVSDTGDLRTLDAGQFLEKELVWDKRTHLFSFGKPALTNFEGMCLGPVLEDGSQTVILINDSQSGSYQVMKEYLCVLKLQL